MRKIVLSILGALVIVSFTTQLAGAAPRSERKVVRAPAHAARQLREAHDSAPDPAPRVVGSKSCDIFWCYQN
jgi:hypothetical protein